MRALNIDVSRLRADDALCLCCLYNVKILLARCGKQELARSSFFGYCNLACENAFYLKLGM